MGMIRAQRSLRLTGQLPQHRLQRRPAGSLPSCVTLEAGHQVLQIVDLAGQVLATLQIPHPEAFVREEQRMEHLGQITGLLDRQPPPVKRLRTRTAGVPGSRHTGNHRPHRPPEQPLKIAVLGSFRERLNLPIEELSRLYLAELGSDSECGPPGLLPQTATEWPKLRMSGSQTRNVEDLDLRVPRLSRDLQQASEGLSQGFAICPVHNFEQGGRREQSPGRDANRVNAHRGRPLPAVPSGNFQTSALPPEGIGEQATNHAPGGRGLCGDAHGQGPLNEKRETISKTIRGKGVREK